jgi:hypothetical protein
MISRGQFNAFIYRTQQQKFLGLTVSGWLKNLPLLLLFIGLWQGWPAAVLILLLAAAVLIRYFYWLIKRQGYVTFKPDPQVSAPAAVEPLANNQKMNVCVTGILSVNDREAYLIEQPGEYWRVPMGEHVIMVQEKPGWFLYQFMQGETLQAIRPGLFHFGSEPRQALAVDYFGQWGPEFAQYENLYYVPGDGKGPRRRRTLYFTFDSDQDRLVVWNTLLQDLGETAHE